MPKASPSPFHLESDRVHYFLVFSVCLVKHSEATCGCFGYTQALRTQCHSVIMSQLDFMVHTGSLCAGSPQQREVLVKKCLTMSLCVIIQIKKTELSVQCVFPAPSPCCVKHKLILYGSDTDVCTVLVEKNQIKDSWHLKFY